jgi:twitching motility two-component system response regulator PilH
MPAHKIMVVDDSVVDLHYLKSIIESAGHQVVTATSGREAVEKARSLRPDLILMDVVMEGGDGYAACRAITSDREIGKIPVVFVTSKSQRADRVWAELQGGRGLIAKPYSADEIIRTIASL